MLQIELKEFSFRSFSVKIVYDIIPGTNDGIYAWKIFRLDGTLLKASELTADYFDSPIECINDAKDVINGWYDA